MPIISYFSVVGSVLLGLLFVADATLEKKAPARVSQFVSSPSAYESKNSNTSLAAMLAPAPDMSSDAVKAASVATPSTQTDSTRVPTAAVVAKKKNNVVLRQPQDDRQNYAWSRNENNSFGGRHFFGRF